MNDLQFIPLANIEPIKNYRDTEPVSEKDPDVIELSKSFLKVGVLQPVLLRPKNGTGKYELIFGHRRLAACKAAGLEQIPANIKEVPDGDILELQVTENLQRKDVHPMDEAIAFRSLIKEKHYQVEEIAARFGKQPAFVTQRLKLNDLAPDLRKDFKNGQMLLGHALLICRLTEKDQVELRKNRVGQYRSGYGTVSDIEEYIERHIMHKLSSAPFKHDDETLNKTAGPCTSCPKRSGTNPLLFPDVREDDRCFDAACFATKLTVFAVRRITEVIQEEPDILLIGYQHKKTDKAIEKLIKEMKLQVLNEYSGFSTSASNYNGFKKKVKGIWVNGDNLGQTTTIYIKGPSEAKKTTPGQAMKPDEVKDSIARIRDREKRAKELDIEKVHRTTLQQLEAVKELKKPGLKHQGVIDRGIMVYLLITEAAGYEARDSVRSGLSKLPKKQGGIHAYQVDYIKALGKLSDDDIAFICRTICLKKWGNPKTVSGITDASTTLKLIAEYAGVDTKTIEKEQAAAAEARAERVKKRIKGLNDQIAQKPKKEEKAPSKTASKKTASQKPKKENAKTKLAKKVFDKAFGPEEDDLPGSGFDSVEEIEGFEDGGI